MKKYFSILSVFAFTFLFASCKKDYVCECTDSSIASFELNVTFEKKSKTEAEDACEQLDDEGGTSRNCEIKEK